MVPDRSREVAVLCAAHPDAFKAGEMHDATRLALLIGVIIPALNRLDGGEWGCLTKTDQGNKVPCDVLVWKPDNQGIDCLTATGARWHVYPTTFDSDPAWHWTAVDGEPPGPPPDPAPSPDASLPVFFGILTRVGTVVPQSGGFVVLIDADGDVVSMQPDGRLEWRAPGTVGAWELATRVGANLLRYEGTGSVYFLAVRAR